MLHAVSWHLRPVPGLMASPGLRLVVPSHQGLHRVVPSIVAQAVVGRSATCVLAAARHCSASIPAAAPRLVLGLFVFPLFPAFGVCGGTVCVSCQVPPTHATFPRPPHQLQALNYGMCVVRRAMARGIL